MKVTVKVSGTQAVRLQMQRLARAPFKALAQTAEDVEELAEAGAAKHNKTGALVRSLYLRRIADGFEVGHDLQHAPHAVFVHWGTKPHVIRPKNKKTLRWPSGGAFSFARSARHPGYKGDPWLVRAAAQAPRLFAARLTALLATEQ